MDRNQKKYILTVICFILAASLMALGMHLYDFHLRRVAENGPGTVSEVHVVHRFDGTPALLTVAHIRVRQHRGRGTSPLALHRLDVIDAGSGKRLLRRSWDDDKAWPRCRDAGRGLLRCRSRVQQLHHRSLATLDELEEGDATDGEAAFEKPASDSSRSCTAKRASSGKIVFETKRAKTSIREVVSVKESRNSETRICAEPELIAPEILCDGHTGAALNIGVEKTVVVDHKNTLLAGADTRHALTVIDAECRVLWQRELEVAGRVAFASVVGKTLVVLASHSSHGASESHLLGIDPATGTLCWSI